MRPKKVSFDQVITYTFYCRTTIGRKWRRAPLIKVPEGRFQPAIKPCGLRTRGPGPWKSLRKSLSEIRRVFPIFQRMRKVAETARACTSITGDVWRSIRIEEGPRICKRGPVSSLSPRLWGMCRIYLRWWHHIKLIRATGKTVRKSHEREKAERPEKRSVYEIFFETLQRQVLSGWKNGGKFYIRVVFLVFFSHTMGSIIMRVLITLIFVTCRRYYDYFIHII